MYFDWKYNLGFLWSVDRGPIYFKLYSWKLFWIRTSWNIRTMIADRLYRSTCMIQPKFFYYSPIETTVNVMERRYKLLPVQVHKEEVRLDDRQPAWDADHIRRAMTEEIVFWILDNRKIKIESEKNYERPLPSIIHTGTVLFAEEEG